MIIKKKLPKIEDKERGDIVSIIITVAGFAIMLIMLLNFSAMLLNVQPNKNIEASNCPSETKEITDNFIQYVENYRINNPNRELEEIIISPHNMLDSKQYETLLSDKKFSEIANKSNCTILKYEPDNGNQFVIKQPVSTDKSESITKDNIVWETVHSSKN